MINRYKNNEIANIWSDKNKLKLWWKVEKNVYKNWSKLGLYDTSLYNDLKKIDIKINIERMHEIEQITKHDVVAFTRMISEQIKEEKIKKWIHFGLTSTDIVDTSQSLMIQESNIITLNNLNKLLYSLKKQALSNKNILIMGRTHGIKGEPISLGLKFLMFYKELQRQEIRINNARQNIEVTNISGSMGNMIHVEPRLEQMVAKDLKLNLPSINNQVIQRDNHIEMIASICNLASTLEKIAVEIRLLQQSEINEIAEGFSSNQKGSSSMPHKKNPISSENICGISRMIKSYINVSMENNALWHERDISHSSNERILFPDIYELINYILVRMTNTIDNISINKEKIQINIDNSNNIFYSQYIMNELIKKTNYSRENIYDFIQSKTIESFNKKTDFINILKNSDNPIAKCIDFNTINLKIFQKNIDEIFNNNI